MRKAKKCNNTQILNCDGLYDGSSVTALQIYCQNALLKHLVKTQWPKKNYLFQIS